MERESKEAEAREEEERLRLETMNLAVFCGDAKKVVGTRILDRDGSFRGNHVALTFLLLIDCDPEVAAGV